MEAIVEETLALHAEGEPLVAAIGLESYTAAWYI